MNKRIEQLVIEAFFDESTNGGDQKMYTFGEDKIQKFAELIIQECAETAESCFVRFPWNGGEQNIVCAYTIRNHFGVEE